MGAQATGDGQPGQQPGGGLVQQRTPQAAAPDAVRQGRMTCTSKDYQVRQRSGRLRAATHRHADCDLHRGIESCGRYYFMPPPHHANCKESGRQSRMRASHRGGNQKHTAFRIPSCKTLRPPLPLLLRASAAAARGVALGLPVVTAALGVGGEGCRV